MSKSLQDNSVQKSQQQTIEDLRMECIDTADIGAESMNWLNTLFTSISEKSDALSDVKIIADIGIFITDSNSPTFESIARRMGSHNNQGGAL